MTPILITLGTLAFFVALWLFLRSRQPNLPDGKKAIPYKAVAVLITIYLVGSMLVEAWKAIK